MTKYVQLNYRVPRNYAHLELTPLSQYSVYLMNHGLEFFQAVDPKDVHTYNYPKSA